MVQPKDKAWMRSFIFLARLISVFFKTWEADLNNNEDIARHSHYEGRLNLIEAPKPFQG